MTTAEQERAVAYLAASQGPAPPVGQFQVLPYGYTRDAYGAIHEPGTPCPLRFECNDTRPFRPTLHTVWIVFWAWATRTTFDIGLTWTRDTSVTCTVIREKA